MGPSFKVTGPLNARMGGGEGCRGGEEDGWTRAWSAHPSALSQRPRATGSHTQAGRKGSDVGCCRSLAPAEVGGTS